MNYLKVYVCMYGIYILPLWFSNKVVFVLTVLSKTILLFYEPEIMMQDWGVLMEILMKTQVLWDVMLYWLENSYRHLKISCHTYFHRLTDTVTFFVERYLLTSTGSPMYPYCWVMPMCDWASGVEFYLGWCKLKVCSHAENISLLPCNGCNISQFYTSLAQ